jgi:hypothetical protein
MSKTDCSLTQYRLRELLNYNPETGVFTWLTKTARRIHIGDIAGCKTTKGYLVVSIDYRLYFAHRLAFLYMTGASPNSQIDHIDGNRANNRFENLRDVSRSVNLQNTKRASKNNKTGLLGVGRCANRFRSTIQVSGKPLHLGMFATPELAHAAYIEAKRIHHVGCTI